jgi:hypothetical protein
MILKKSIMLRIVIKKIYLKKIRKIINSYPITRLQQELKLHYDANFLSLTKTDISMWI